MLTKVRKAKTGAIWVRELISISFENPIPIPMPSNDDVVKVETDFPAISAILLLLANLILICAREAAAIRKVIFLHMLAVEARSRK